MANLTRSIPDGDGRERTSCVDCGHVFYENPKIVVGSVVEHEGRVLLCRRAIAPRRGHWTLPAGYLEMGETLAEGAAREADEEANVRLEIEGVLALFSIARIGQIQVIHRARFAGGIADFAPGAESLEVALFGADEIPWSDLAFPSVGWALETWLSMRGRPLGVPATNPTHDPRGAIAPEMSEALA